MTSNYAITQSQLIIASIDWINYKRQLRQNYSKLFLYLLALGNASLPYRLFFVVLMLFAELAEEVVGSGETAELVAQYALFGSGNERLHLLGFVEAV